MLSTARYLCGAHFIIDHRGTADTNSGRAEVNKHPNLLDLDSAFQSLSDAAEHLTGNQQLGYMQCHLEIYRRRYLYPHRPRAADHPLHRVMSRKQSTLPDLPAEMFTVQSLLVAWLIRPRTTTAGTATTMLRGVYSPIIAAPCVITHRQRLDA
ncbi:hypothetical protein [Mycobacterium lepromatosis]|uniref:hypothetical protein n=1 Tax=Mycobacterium lepromatosis TaxID=480418 RepID=UPI0005F7D5BF|nr:hypothetical protein [Mycobacterium lepromatosis]